MRRLVTSMIHCQKLYDQQLSTPPGTRFRCILAPAPGCRVPWFTYHWLNCIHNRPGASHALPNRIWGYFNHGVATRMGVPYVPKLGLLSAPLTPPAYPACEAGSWPSPRVLNRPRQEIASLSRRYTPCPAPCEHVQARLQQGSSLSYHRGRA